MGIYLDDSFSSATIYGNVFFDVTAAAFIGGGRDNVVDNNLFVECNPALHIDARGMGVAEIPVFTAGSLLADVPLQSGGPTLYLVAGEWFAILCLLLSAIRMIILIREDLRSRRRKA